MTETIRSQVVLPKAYKDAIPDGEDLSGFIREAMRREFRRRKIKVADVGEIRRGRPSSP